MLHRLTWNVRELVAAWELRGDDIAITPLANLFPLVAKAVRGPRVVLFDWGLGTALARASGRRRSLLRAAVRSAAAVLCPSPTQRADVIDSFGLDESRVHLVELGVDERFFTASTAPPEDFVLAVGKDLARDYRTLAAATAAGGFRTILVAHPRNVEGLQVPRSLEVRHDVDWDELRDLYARAACVVLPLREPRASVGTDGSGLTAALEAMASGKAVVASQRPALETYVEEGRTGVLVPAEDPGRLAAAVRGVLEDPVAAAAMGAAARSAVEQRLNTRALAGRLAPLLTSLGSGEG
jgi:glycosyltransferase involved in cell wall biosynthesis